MQNCRPPSFLHTNTMSLHHSLWLWWIASTSSISFMCAWTSSTMGGGILWNFSLKGSSSNILVLCFVRSVQSNSPGSKEKMLWYSASRAQTAAWSWSDLPSRQDKSRCWKSTSFLHSTDILVCWIPCISSSFSKVPGTTSTGGTCICNYYSCDHHAFDYGDQRGSQVLHHNCNSLTPSHHLSVGIHDTQAMRQAGSITPFQGLCHYMHVATQKHGLCSGMYNLGQKSIYFVPLYCFDSFIQVSQIHGLICSHFTSNGKFCSTACQQAGYPWPIQGSQQLIYFTLFDHIYDPIDGWHAKSNWHSGSQGSWIWYDQGHLIFIIALYSFYLNPYDNIAPGLGE